MTPASNTCTTFECDSSDESRASSMNILRLRSFEAQPSCMILSATVLLTPSSTRRRAAHTRPMPPTPMGASSS